MGPSPAYYSVIGGCLRRLLDCAPAPEFRGGSFLRVVDSHADERKHHICR